MIPSAVAANSEKIASWITICLVTRMSWPLIPVVRRDQRVAARWRDVLVARAGRLPDCSAPLQLQPRQIALIPGPGEEALVNPTQRQVDNQRQVGVIAAQPVGQRLLREGERRQEAQ